MRPVNRGPVTTYPNNIRLDTINNLRADASQPPNWNFNAPTVNTALGTYTPSRWQLLLAEWCLATLTIPGGLNWTIQNLNAAFATIDRRLTSDANGGYQLAGPPLGVRLGKFCSYCEQFLPGQIAVEHCTPKSPFPLFMICWDNFLLGCEACNGPTGKGSSPTRNEVNSWGVYPDDCARNVAIRGTAGNPAQARYLWPDLNPLAYRNLLPQLTVRQPGGQWGALPVQDSMMPGIVITGLDLPNRIITATVHYNGAWYPNQRVAVWLLPADQQATVSIPYYGLDRDGTGTGKIADCRMYNRTIAWFKAVQFLTPLVQNMASFPYVWPLILSGAPSVGFFSVWVRVLDQMGFGNVALPNSNPQISVLHGFMNAMATAGGFPNTNAAAVP